MYEIRRNFENVRRNLHLGFATSKRNVSRKEKVGIGCSFVSSKIHYKQFAPMTRGADHKLDTDKLNVMPIKQKVYLQKD